MALVQGKGSHVEHQYSLCMVGLDVCSAGGQGGQGCTGPLTNALKGVQGEEFGKPNSYLAHHPAGICFTQVEGHGHTARDL
jgi:hypothetical protein